MGEVATCSPFPLRMDRGAKGLNMQHINNTQLIKYKEFLDARDGRQ